MPDKKIIKVPNFQTEAKFSRWFKKKLEEEFGERILVTNVTGTGYGTQGVSDLIICFLGIFIACELKLNGKKLTKLQMIYAMKVDRAGGRTLTPVMPSTALNAIDYLRTIQQFREGTEIVRSLDPDEAQEVLDEANVILDAEAMEGERDGDPDDTAGEDNV